MKNFFLYGYFPPLDFSTKLEISSEEYWQLCSLILSKKDLEEMQSINLCVDILDIYPLFFEREEESASDFQKDLQKFLEDNKMGGLPIWLEEYLAACPTSKEKIVSFPQLLSDIYQEKKKKRGRFFEFLAFEHDIRILQVGVRVKKMQGDLLKELQFEDLEDEVVSFVLTQQNISSDKLYFPVPYKDLESILESSYDQPIRRYYDISRYRFDYYMKIFEEGFPFIKGLVAYMIALRILEDAQKLRETDGEEWLHQVNENAVGEE